MIIRVIIMAVRGNVGLTWLKTAGPPRAAPKLTMPQKITTADVNLNENQSPTIISIPVIPYKA